ncbi:MAG: hypothetical protein JWM41_3605 [Gemmatimonadetes bacterium]|nr:hypothetical protein [Gemmatimonadota bacterium]
MSYLDLSDAIVTGNWSRLVNLYWSPAYPVLIGLARLVARAGPATEIAVIHAVNLLCFVALLGAFDYMLMSVLSLSAITKRSPLAEPLGVAGAYVLFGCFALTMIPLELTTPDLLNGACAFAAFGAMLRLHTGTHHPRRDAIVLGAALGLGALTKSFMVPWALVCFAVMALALRRRGLRELGIAVGVWLVFLLPWSVVMSKAAGRPTFGDAGRLTYAWYVNGQDTPSLGGVPPGTRRQNTEAILPGVGVPGDTTGSDPMWFDPARWNQSVAPHLSFDDQLKMVKVFIVFYVMNFSPLLFLILLVAVAPPGTRRVAWRRGWVVYVPALAGLAAYAMVIVTARYVMPFVLAATLTVLATIPIAQRMRPTLLLLGLAIPIALEFFHPLTVPGLALVTSVVGGMLAGVLTPTRRRVGWIVSIAVALTATRILLTPSIPEVLRAGAVALMLILWRTSYVAVRGGRTVQFAARAQASLGFLLATLLLFRVGLRLDQDAAAARRAASAAVGNVSWNIALELQSHGIAPGARIAVIGPHAESYWARAGRMHIVANVPRPRAEAFWQLPRAAQDALLNEFAAAGATVAIASVGPEHGQPDSSWTPVRYRGWIRPLVRPAR